MVSAIPSVKSALLGMMQTALASDAEVLVCVGHPGETPAADIVAVMDAESLLAPTVMTVAPRPLDETLTVTVIVSCWRGGGREVQATVDARAYTLIGVIDTAVRADTTLAGTVWDARISGILHPAIDDPDLLASGRLAEVTVTIECRARV